MANIIDINGKETNWVVGGSRVNFWEITKSTLKFMEKAWWTLVRHRLCPTTGDNVLSPIHVPLIVGLRASTIHR